MDSLSLFVLFGICDLVLKLLYPVPIQWDDNAGSEQEPSREDRARSSMTCSSMTSGEG
jgi:hypothetical protein